MDEEISNNPKQHPDCCLSLSQKVLDTLEELIRRYVCTNGRSTSLLSVGCGSGLFEALLASHLQKHGLKHVLVEGVEVPSTEAPYLNAEEVHRVHGSWDIFGGARNADVLLFVYPRTGQLIQQYLKNYQANTRLVIWLGPRADWSEQEPLLRDLAGFHRPLQLNNAGLMPYEVAVILVNEENAAP